MDLEYENKLVIWCECVTWVTTRHCWYSPRMWELTSLQQCWILWVQVRHTLHNMHTYNNLFALISYFMLCVRLLLGGTYLSMHLHHGGKDSIVFNLIWHVAHLHNYKVWEVQLKLVIVYYENQSHLYILAKKFRNQMFLDRIDLTSLNIIILYLETY